MRTQWAVEQPGLQEAVLSVSRRVGPVASKLAQGYLLTEVAGVWAEAGADDGHGRATGATAAAWIQPTHDRLVVVEVVGFTRQPGRATIQAEPH